MAASLDITKPLIGDGSRSISSTGRRVLTSSERAELLDGYRDIPKNYWPKLQYGRHVRFFYNDNTSSAGIVATGCFKSATGQKYLSLKAGGTRKKIYHMVESTV